MPGRASSRTALIAAAAQAACLLEVMAPKPGNVGRGRDLPGLSYGDFVLSAYAIGPAFRSHLTGRVGRLILEAVRRTRRQVRTNTNLGIVLLLAPLARAALEKRGTFRDRLRRVLDALDVRDARDAYRAIRMAEAGGLGTVEEQDVRKAPTLSLLGCMRLAAGRDAVAREYATGFETSIAVGLPIIGRLRDRHVPLPVAIAQTYLVLLAESPDTLVVRRHGAAAASTVRRRARRIVEAGGCLTERGRVLAERLDRDLRAARPPRNPGATADLTVASLFLWLLDDQGLLGRIGKDAGGAGEPRATAPRDTAARATAPRRRPRGSSRGR